MYTAHTVCMSDSMLNVFYIPLYCYNNSLVYFYEPPQKEREKFKVIPQLNFSSTYLCKTPSSSGNSFPNLALPSSLVTIPLSVQIQHRKRHSLCYELLFLSTLTWHLILHYVLLLLCFTLWWVLYLWGVKGKAKIQETFGFGESNRNTWWQEHSRTFFFCLCLEPEYRASKGKIVDFHNPF